MSISDITLEPMSAARKMISCSAASATSSSSAQLRKIKKPLIERRRRERINECLGQLKALVLEATNKDESRYSKMEKADILEMTVAHLKFVHSARRSTYSDSGRAGCRSAEVLPAVAGSLAEETSGGAAALRYLMGYNECVREVASYLAGDDGETGRLGDDVRIALMRHLDDCLRLRAAEPLAAAVRLPSPNVPCDRFDGPTAIVGASSPAVVDSAGATPWRHRCDSGVYSGASSPAQADEPAAGTGPPSPLELTTRTKEPTRTSTTIYCHASQLQQPPHTPDETPSEVWRPW